MNRENYTKNIDEKYLKMFDGVNLKNLEDTFEMTFNRKIESAPFEMDDTSYIEKLMQSIATGVDHLKEIAATYTDASIVG